MTTTTDTTRYFVVPAPGHYGDSAPVLSAHRTMRAARRAAGHPIELARGVTLAYVVRSGMLRKGETLYRAAESLYPIVREG